MVSVLETILQKHFVSVTATKCAEQVVKRETADKGKRSQLAWENLRGLAPFFALPAVVGFPPLESIFCLASRPNGTTEQRICLSYYSTLQQIL